MAANVEAMVREGMNALKAGRKEEARALLMKAVEIDEQNEDAWLWLSAVVETEEDQRTCLENVLAINPTNERALQGLSYLAQQQRGATAEYTTVNEPTPAPPPVYAPPPSAPATSTSVEWGLPSDAAESAVPANRAPDLSEEDYDNWVSTLNLPTGAKSPDIASTTPFLLDDIDTDAFEDPEFDENTIPAPPPSMGKSAAKREQSKVPIPGFGDEVDEEGEAEPARRGSFKLPAMPKLPVISLPKRERAEKPEPEPVEPLFADIPEEIRATRMPGTNERISAPVLALLLLVIGANIGMVILLVQTYLLG